MMLRLACIAVLPLLLSGCIVHAAYDVATAPIRATAWTADKLTTSQKEADRNRGRRERKAEERQAKAERKLRRRRPETGWQPPSRPPPTRPPSNVG